jgi:hypothetical protein
MAASPDEQGITAAHRAFTGDPRQLVHDASFAKVK